MQVAINDKGRPVVVNDAGTVIGEITNIAFPTITIPTHGGDVHEIDRAGLVICDVTLTNGERVPNVELPIR